MSYHRHCCKCGKCMDMVEEDDDRIFYCKECEKQIKVMYE